MYMKNNFLKVVNVFLLGSGKDENSITYFLLNVILSYLMFLSRTCVPREPGVLWAASDRAVDQLADVERMMNKK